MSENVHVQLKIQALQIACEHQKTQNDKLENTVLEEFKAAKDEIIEIKESIKDINFRLAKNFLSFENLGKRLLFLASIFGALQVLFKFIIRLLK